MFEEKDKIGFVNLNEKNAVLIRGVSDIFIRATGPGHYGDLVQIAEEGWSFNFFTISYALMMILAAVAGNAF